MKQRECLQAAAGGLLPFAWRWAKRIAYVFGIGTVAIVLGVELYNGLTIGRVVLPSKDLTQNVDTTRTQTGVMLSIEDRSWDEKRPRGVGWCGETALQMGALYYGAFIPQRTINRLGEPKHADLWAWDIPLAIEKLHIRHYPYATLFQHAFCTAAQRFWRGKGYGLDDFIKWQRLNLDAGRPVVAGILVSPQRAPFFAPLDHFVLTVGYDLQSISYNANNGDNTTRTESLADLRQPDQSWTYVNPMNYYFGYALDGFDFGDRSQPVSLKLTEEDANSAAVQAKIGALQKDGKYQLCEFRGNQDIPELTLSHLKKTNVREFIAEAPVMKFDLGEVRKDTCFVVRCYSVAGK